MNVGRNELPASTPKQSNDPRLMNTASSPSKAERKQIKRDILDTRVLQHRTRDRLTKSPLHYGFLLPYMAKTAFDRHIRSGPVASKLAHGVVATLVAGAMVAAAIFIIPHFAGAIVTPIVLGLAGAAAYGLLVYGYKLTRAKWQGIKKERAPNLSNNQGSDDKVTDDEVRDYEVRGYEVGDAEVGNVEVGVGDAGVEGAEVAR